MLEVLAQTNLDINWLQVLEKVDYVAFDTENNGYINLFDPRVRINGFSLAVKSSFGYVAGYIPCNHIRGSNVPREIWEPIIRKVLTKKIICHNVNFDARSARLLLGEDLDKPFEYFFDTTRMCHMVNENALENREWSLENCCEFFLGEKGKVKNPIFTVLLQLYGWDGIAGIEIDEYATNDALATYRLWEYCANKLAKEPGADNIRYWKEIEMENYKVLYDMRDIGIGVDIEYCKKWEKICEAKLEQIKAELGFDPSKANELKDVFYNQLGLPIITAKRKRKDGSVVYTPTLDSKAMERYEVMLERLDNPIARRIIEYRGWTKGLTSYYRPYQEHVCTDGRIRSSFNSAGTVNGRYACSKPNVQQIPKEADSKPWVKDVKRCFVPMEGYELWEFDYAQLELRLGAAFGEDKELLEILNDPNRDIFSEIASKMGWQRQTCKTFVYSIDYGAGKQRVSDIFGVSLDKAKELIEDFYEAYPGLGRANDEAKYEANTTGRVRYWSGHFRHFTKKEDTYKAFNSKIQGGAADMVKIVMNRLKKAMPELRIVSQVHDALWFEIPREQSWLYRTKIKEIMENPFPDVKIIKFPVDGHPIGGWDYGQTS